MNFVVLRATLEVLTYAAAQQRENDLQSGVVLGFSDEGLEGTDYALLQVADMPLPDSRYWRAVLGEVVEQNGQYLAGWQIVPVDEPINVLAQRKLAEINSACAQAIGSGFGSMALGAVHHYSCDAESQLNIQGNVMIASRGRDVRHICYNAQGERVVMLHTPEQMEQVGEDMAAHIWQHLDHANNLRTAIDACVANNDVQALLALGWGSEV